MLPGRARGAVAAALALSVSVAGCPASPLVPAVGGPDATAVVDSQGASGDSKGSPAPVVIGQHPTQTMEPALFVPLEDGGPLDLIFGHQGLFMVVLGLRSQAHFAGAMQVSLALESGGTTVASVARKEMRTVHFTDGFDYLWELQIIIDGELWRGRPATLTVGVVDEHGTTFDGTWDVVIGEPELPGVCLEPSPSPTGAHDNCDAPPGLAHRLDPGGPTDSIDVRPGLGKSSVLAGGRRGNQLLLWESVVDVNPAIAHHQALGNTAPWVDPVGPSSGPWPLAVDGMGAALVWGSMDGSVYVAAPGSGPTALLGGAVAAAFTVPDGFKVLVDVDGSVTAHTFAPDLTQLSAHFVVHTAKASGSLAATVEGELIIVTFPGLDPSQPVQFQTASIFGGQCSLPSPLGLELGEGTTRHATGQSYGRPIFLVTRPALSDDCSPSYRILSKSLSGGGVLDTESAIRWNHGARVVANDDVAAAIGLANLGGRWQLVAQYADQATLAPGSVAVGPEVTGDVPDTWDVTRQDRFAMAWSDTGGAWLQRFCFRDPGSDGR